MSHVSVLTEKVIQYLNVKDGGVFVDGTLNGGGHAKAILAEGGGDTTVVGIERDPELIKKIKKESISHLIIHEGNYKDMASIIKKHKIKKVDGVLFDFGMSSWHLEDSGRGFSFLRDEALDMRFSPKEEGTLAAAEIINSYTESQLVDIFREYGEMTNARKIAQLIVKARKTKRIMTTGELLEITHSQSRGSRRHPATQLFQALRIAVNRELETVAAGLEAAMDLVRPGGRVVAISFHSLEDRIVKNIFRSRGTVITKKPVRASHEEQKNNPRSRSALLRAWENA